MSLRVVSLQRAVLAVAMVLAVVAPLLGSAPAAAAPFGGPEHTGYFQEVQDDWGGPVLSAGIHPKANPLSATGKPYVSSFISEIEDDLRGAHGTGQNQTGAEFIILTMLGYPRGTAKGEAHKAAVIQDWEDRVQYYSDNDYVNWDENGVSHLYNTYWQGSLTGSNPDDDAYFTEAAADDDVIVFNAPGQGGIYRIRQACGNPIGDNTALNAPPAASSNLSLAVSGGTTVSPGQTYAVTIALKNTGSGASPDGQLELIYPGAGWVVAPCAAACNPSAAQMSGISNVANTIRTFRQSSAITTGAPAPPNLTNWYWDAPGGVPASRTGTAVVTFTVAANAPGGTSFTFSAFYSPGNSDGVNLTAQTTFNVQSSRTPSFIGSSGDIHAGACTGVNGSVTGASAGSSYGQYVISASGTIAGVDSNGPGGGNTLNLGANGNYSQVCRPDLLAAANKVRTSYATLGLPTVDVGTLTADTYFSDAPHLHLYGTVNHKLTIVVPSGDVTIVNNGIRLNTGVFDRTDQPSLGIIASGDINIDPTATEVDAYLFSNDTINTCTPGALASACANRLTVDGFLMSRGIAFNRTGPVGSTGAQSAETVNLSPQLYLNPPRFFDNEVDNILLEGQGEARPLF